MPMMRSVKNIVKNYTDAEVKVREATSNDPWGPSSTLMAEIADLTYNVVAFTEIMQMVWKRLNDHGKNWRHVYKSLTLLEYIIKTGSEKVSQQCKENIFAIQTLKDFQHMEDNKDLGANVREKAKMLVALLKDDERLKNERAKALKAKERFSENFGIGSDSSQTQLGKRHRQHHQVSKSGSGTLANPEMEEARPHSIGEEELQLQLALAMSKEEADSEKQKRTNDDLKLQLALEESKREDLPAQQAEEDLLGFSAGAGATGGLTDPWATSTQPSAGLTDPWGMQPAQSGPFSPPVAANDPWSPAATAAAPTYSNASSMSSNNPWDTPTQGAESSVASMDPWADSPTPAKSNSPWETPTNGNSKQSADDDFDMLISRTSAPSSQPASDSGDIFSMGSVGQSLPVQTSTDSKSFLDPKAAGLVNLDSLVSKPAGGASGAINPFAMTPLGASTTVGGPSSVNPFIAAQPPRPSLNQISATNQMAGFQSGPVLPNPMMPSGGMGYPMGYPPQQMQQQAQTNNPFL